MDCLPLAALALELLEHTDSADARALLADLARTAPGVRVHQEAHASLQRVRKRPPSTIIKPLPPDGPPRPTTPPPTRR